MQYGKDYGIDKYGPWQRGDDGLRNDVDHIDFQIWIQRLDALRVWNAWTAVLALCVERERWTGEPDVRSVRLPRKSGEG